MFGKYCTVCGKKLLKDTTRQHNAYSAHDGRTGKKYINEITSLKCPDFDRDHAQEFPAGHNRVILKSKKIYI